VLTSKTTVMIILTQYVIQIVHTIDGAELIVLLIVDIVKVSHVTSIRIQN